MTITARVATPQDFAECLAIVQSSSAYGARLDAFLPSVWEELTATRRVGLRVIEEQDGAHRRLLGFRCGCFVTTAFAQEIHDGLPPCLSEQMYRRHREGHSPILERSAIARANANDGVIAVSYTVHRDEVVLTEKVTAYGLAISQAFASLFLGYCIAEVFIENYGATPLEQMRRAGFYLVTQYADHYAPHTDAGSRFFLMHIARERSLHEQGTYIAPLFTGYTPPRLHLAPHEQEMLEYALENDSEAWLAARCCCAPITVRKRWDTIFARVQQAAPDVLTGTDQEAHSPARTRAALNRHRLLNHLRSHPEELRPYSASG